jgi:hypothetical protein
MTPGNGVSPTPLTWLKGWSVRRGASQRAGTERRTPNTEHRTSQRRTLEDCKPQKEESAMPIPWKAIQRRNPRDPNAAAKYYAMDLLARC